MLAELRRLVEAAGGQKQLEVATRRKLRQQVISRYLLEPTPDGRPGYKFAQNVAEAAGLTVEELLHRRTGLEPPLSAHPDWPEAARQAIDEEPAMRDKINAVGRIRVPDEIALNSEFVLAMAYGYSRGKPRPKT